MNPNNVAASNYPSNTVNPQGNSLSSLNNPSNNIGLQNNTGSNSINNSSNVNGVTINNYNSSSGVQSIYTPPKAQTHNKNYFALSFIIILFAIAIAVFWYINRSSRKNIN